MISQLKSIIKQQWNSNMDIKEIKYNRLVGKLKQSLSLCYVSGSYTRFGDIHFAYIDDYHNEIQTTYNNITKLSGGIHIPYDIVMSVLYEHFKIYHGYIINIWDDNNEYKRDQIKA